MSRVNIPASTLHRTIAEVAAFLETNVNADQWGFLDSGETLEIYTATLNECRQSPMWTTLEARYESVGGSIYAPDDNEWEVAS